MITLSSSSPIRIQDLEIVQSMDCVGTKISFRSPDIVAIQQPIVVKVKDQSIFEGKVEARRFLFSPDKEEKTYGGRDNLTVVLDTCPYPQELVGPISIESLINLIAPETPVSCEKNLPKIQKFYIDPGETILEVVQRAAKLVGARSFIANGKLQIAKKPKRNNRSITSNDKITNIEISDNISAIFDETFYVAQAKDNTKKRKKILTIADSKKELAEFKRMAKLKSCEAVKDSFFATLDLVDTFDYQILDLVSVDLPKFNLTGAFVISEIRTSISLDAQIASITLRKKEAFDY